ncbi:MAG: ribosome maturation factor RimP [Carnobacterium sp.]|uniref:Ribosome maturation factor RimP n=1 Tax=Carnobacterium antarcticum TaxID=2126436 RepID=A0ABW4NJ25_9LACT|nr:MULTISPECIES: ribosome maturation factor RimP [unclassified Carnobacterium]ALV21156.1 transcription termination protein NusA-like protein [Carnobacterium sp. CP1]QQP71293.1 ribosome maturation factor RimP [Carnobacterium sp. CS13]
MSSVVETVTEIVQPIVNEFQFELVDVEFVKEGKNWFLRVYIDKPSGIDLEDCALVSEKISEKMDALNPDPIPQAYFLEVSSPGAERPLKKEEDFVQAIGEYIHISLYEPVDGEKIYEGTLKQVSDETLTLTVRIKTRVKDIEFDRAKIAKARLAIQF